MKCHWRGACFVAVAACTLCAAPVIAAETASHLGMGPDPDPIEFFDTREFRTFEMLMSEYEQYSRVENLAAADAQLPQKRAEFERAPTRDSASAYEYWLIERAKALIELGDYGGAIAAHDALTQACIGMNKEWYDVLAGCRPGHADYGIAKAHYYLGHLDEALAAYSRADQSWVVDRPRAAVLIKVGRAREAVPLAQESLKQELKNEDEQHPAFQRQIVWSMNWLGDAKLAAGDAVGALDQYQAALSKIEGLKPVTPAELAAHFMKQLEDAYAHATRTREGKLHKGEKAFESDVLAWIYMAVPRHWATSVRLQMDTAWTWHRIAAAKRAAGDTRGADLALVEMRKVDADIRRWYPGPPSHDAFVVFAATAVCDMARGQQRNDEALKCYDADIATREKMLREGTTGADEDHRAVGRLKIRRSLVLIEQGNADSAKHSLQEGIDILTRLNAVDRGPQAARDVAWAKEVAALAH